MNWNNYSYLDRIRISQGLGHLRHVFCELAAQNRQRAFNYINDEKLRFPTLFILMPEIEAQYLYEHLNSRNITALKVCAKKLDNRRLAFRLDLLTPQESITTHQVLKWMFHTGIQWKSSKEDSNTYDAIMDASAALLIKTYEDKTVLPAVADLIFKRNREGLFIHDLVWSFFQCFDPDALALLAEYLLSDNLHDVKLACKLLHLQLPEEPVRDETKRKLYRQYHSWLRENRPFLFLTGEHFQLTSDPDPLHSDLEAVYLYREISPRFRRPLEPLTENEMMCLNRFRKTSKEEQKLLAAYSRKLHDQDKRSWDEWIQTQLAQQVSTAKSFFEVG